MVTGFAGKGDDVIMGIKVEARRCEIMLGLTDTFTVTGLGARFTKLVTHMVVLFWGANE
jgi:hypothetical protein